MVTELRLNPKKDLFGFNLCQSVKSVAGFKEVNALAANFADERRLKGTIQIRFWL
jgi:hypothetical protein